MEVLPAEVVAWALAATTPVKGLIDVFTRNMTLPNWVRPAVAMVAGWVVIGSLVLIAETPLSTKVYAQVFLGGLLVVTMAVAITEAQNLRKRG